MTLKARLSVLEELMRPKLAPAFHFYILEAGQKEPTPEQKAEIVEAEKAGRRIICFSVVE